LSRRIPARRPVESEISEHRVALAERTAGDPLAVDPQHVEREERDGRASALAGVPAAADGPEVETPCAATTLLSRLASATVCRPP
jgi:hypothetical protein